jgi:hypothetical protein
LDAITLEIWWSRLVAIADEAVTIRDGDALGTARKPFAAAR